MNAVVVNTKQHCTSLDTSFDRSLDNLTYQLIELCNRNKDGSYGGQKDRKVVLKRTARTLRDLGFRNMYAASLKEKHVRALANELIRRGLSPRTIQNTMSHVRWWARKIGKPQIAQLSNAQLGISSGRRIPDSSKAWGLSRDQLAQIPDKWVQLSLRLQQEFGLRREESLKFDVGYADRGDHIRLKGSWCKGGRPRTVPIVRSAQHDLLTEVRLCVKHGSLIPKSRNYREHLAHFSAMTQRQGLLNVHGLRHGYAQRRYFELTGWDCPFACQGTPRPLGPDEVQPDQEARLTVSRELGHGRVAITNVYLGPNSLRHSPLLNVSE